MKKSIFLNCALGKTITSIIAVAFLLFSSGVGTVWADGEGDAEKPLPVVTLLPPMSPLMPVEVPDMRTQHLVKQKNYIEQMIRPMPPAGSPHYLPEEEFKKRRNWSKDYLELNGVDVSNNEVLPPVQDDVEEEVSDSGDGILPTNIDSRIVTNVKDNPKNGGVAVASNALYTEGAKQPPVIYVPPKPPVNGLAEIGGYMAPLTLIQGIGVDGGGKSHIVGIPVARNRPEIGPPPKRKPPKFRAPKPPEIGPSEIGPPEIGPIEIDATQTGPPKIELPMIEPKIKPPKISPPTLNHPFTEKNSKDEPIVIELSSGAAAMWSAWISLSETLKGLPHVVLVIVTRVETSLENRGNYTGQYTNFYLTVLEELKGKLTSKNIILKRFDGVFEDGRLLVEPAVSTGKIDFEEGYYLMTFRYVRGKLEVFLMPGTIVKVKGPDSPEVTLWREAIG